MKEIRNVAIIAHVDHGKTTLVDALLRLSKTKLDNDIKEETCIMDSNDLEKERGITIFSKNASVVWNDVKINIIDTPGHADFGGEVERVLKMADGCLLLVDAKEGPMPQTRFVLKKALEMGLKIIVVINKIDKKDARPEYALNKTFDLFIELGADESAAYFPVVYSSAKLSKAGETEDINLMTDVAPIFDAILAHIPPPLVDAKKPLQMLVTSVAYDNFKGRIAVGRVFNGTLRANDNIAHINSDGKINPCKLTSVMTYTGLDRIETDCVNCGDIAAISGIEDINIGETVSDLDEPTALPRLMIEEPTVKMTFSVNDSPFAGKEGEFKTSRQVRERLYKELEADMALKVVDSPTGGWIVSGRGELHLAILIERMRREGYEFQVARPKVISKTVDGAEYVPFELLSCDVPDEYAGLIIQSLGIRRGEMKDMNSVNGITALEFIVPTQGLFGFRTEFLSKTRGLGIMNTAFFDYLPDPGNWKNREQGSLVAHETGTTSLYGLVNAQGRGALFIGPAVPVYIGQVVGQNSRIDDIRVNVCKEKHQSNMRSKGEGVSEHFNTPRSLSLEESLEYIDDSELVEVTPQNVRIRKIVLDENEERRKIAMNRHLTPQP